MFLCIYFLDYVDSSIQYMALFISITVCSVILGLILLFFYIRYESPPCLVHVTTILHFLTCRK